MVNEGVTEITEDLKLNATHDVLVVNAPNSTEINVTLPDTLVAGNGRHYRLIRIDSQSAVCNVLPGDVGQLVGGESYVQLYQGDILDIISWGSNWFRLSQ